MQRPSWVALGTVLVAAVLWTAMAFLIVPGARHHDFLNLYTGARLARAGQVASLYDPTTQLATERTLVPRTATLIPFVRPHFYATILSPLAALEFNRAFVVWVAFQTVLLLACWTWGWRRFGPDALVFGALFAPAALGIAHGQDCVVFLAVVIGFYTLAERHRDSFSGAALAFGLVKFHLFMLWPLTLAVSRRWRALAGFSVVSLALGAASFAIGGRTGVSQYIALLQMKNIERLSPSPEKMVNIYSLLANAGVESGGLSFLFGTAVVLATVAAVWRAPLWRLVAGTSCGALLVAPHVYGYDAALLLLGVWLAIFESRDRWTRLAAATVAIPIPYLIGLAGPPWSAAPALALVIFLVTLAVENVRVYWTSRFSRCNASAASL